MASEKFIHALLLFLGLFLKSSRWMPQESHIGYGFCSHIHKKDDLGAISVIEPSSAVRISKVERQTSVPHFGVFCVLV